MAKIYTESLVVTASKLLKSTDDSPDEVTFDEELIAQLTEVFEQLTGEKHVIEVERVAE